ncbi:hypothetical protein APX70_02306 [Pseudomonas syringae pv. maculicola]|uniref:Uncharacterized protein n=1 Tax=Pseudomonas syringae pv. maculicola TaxID=59511 RepID=A0A3M2XD27_PSEYM|nr:hypothetical protein APX70_02306 [Pseudomonas syringae pv. maculicola]
MQVKVITEVSVIFQRGNQLGYGLLVQVRKGDAFGVDSA